MRKMIILACIVFIQISGAASQLWAKDLADMTFRELFILRSTIERTSPAEQDAFQLEWDKRLQSMTEVERKQIEDYDKRREFPNSYVQGQGYDNQGVNSAIFKEETRDQSPADEGTGK